MMAMIRARLRRADLEVLWPICLARTDSYPQAEAIFLVHAARDPAWKDMPTDEIKRLLVEELHRITGEDEYGNPA